MSTHIHSAATRRTALSLFKKGVRLTAIADTLGVHRHTVARWQQEAGITREKPRHGFPEKLIRAAMARYAKGDRPEAIAADLGIGRSTVDGWATKRGVVREKPLDLHQHDKTTREAALKYYREGKTGTWIAEVLGISARCVYTWCEAAGIPRRPRYVPARLDDALVARTFERWKSQTAVAEILGVSRRAVQRSLKRSSAAAEQRAAA